MLLALLLMLQVPSPGDVLASRNTDGRTGVNSAEKALVPTRINAASFGKLWTLYADGQVVGELDRAEVPAAK